MRVKAKNYPKRFLDTLQCFQKYLTGILEFILAPHGGETGVRRPICAATPRA